MLTSKQKQYISRFNRLDADTKRVNEAIDVLMRNRKLDTNIGGDAGEYRISDKLTEIRDDLQAERKEHPLMAFLNENVTD